MLQSRERLLSSANHETQGAGLALAQTCAAVGRSLFLLANHATQGGLPALRPVSSNQWPSKASRRSVHPHPFAFDRILFSSV